jgi:hypothetical protein
MKPNAVLGLVLVAMLIGFAHLAMYVPGGVGTPGLIGLAVLAFVLVIYLTAGGARRLLHQWTHHKEVPGVPTQPH